MDGIISFGFCENDGGGTRIKQKSIREIIERGVYVNNKKVRNETKGLDYF